MLHIWVFPNFLLSPGPKGKAICSLSHLLFPTLPLYSREGSAPEQIMEKTTPWWWSFPGSSTGKESTCNVGDPRSIPELGKSPGEGISYPLQYSWASLVAQLVKNPLAMQEPPVWFLSWEAPLEKGYAPHSSINPVDLAHQSYWTIACISELFYLLLENTAVCSLRIFWREGILSAWGHWLMDKSKSIGQFVQHPIPWDCYQFQYPLEP